jgi:hypothetical protein
VLPVSAQVPICRRFSVQLRLAQDGVPPPRPVWVQRSQLARGARPLGVPVWVQVLWQSDVVQARQVRVLRQW